MTGGRRVIMALAGAACLVSAGCYGVSSATYVGVSGPGPWYGYPYPGGRGYPGSFGGFVGVTFCCEEEQQQQDGQQEDEEEQDDEQQP